MKGHPNRGHQLMTKELLRALPPTGSQEGMEDPQVAIKYFSPFTGWTWYATEGSVILADGNEISGLEFVDGKFPDTMLQDVIFFGYVEGVECEWGSFGLNELEGVTRMNGKLPVVERDCHFKPRPLSEVKTR